MLGAHKDALPQLAPRVTPCAELDVCAQARVAIIIDEPSLVAASVGVESQFGMLPKITHVIGSTVLIGPQADDAHVIDDPRAMRERHGGVQAVLTARRMIRIVDDTAKSAPARARGALARWLGLVLGAQVGGHIVAPYVVVGIANVGWPFTAADGGRTLGSIVLVIADWWWCLILIQSGWHFLVLFDVAL